MKTSLKQIKRQPLAILVDSCIVINTYTLATLALFVRETPFSYLVDLVLFLTLAVLIHCAVNLKLGLYNAVGRYVGVNQAVKIVQASTLSIVLLLTGALASKPAYATQILALIPIGGGGAFILMSAIRFYPRIFYEKSLRELTPKLRLLIVGAGSAGELIIRSIQKERNVAFEIVALVDDNPQLSGLEIHGIKIYGPTEIIPELVEQKVIDEILIAIPSASLEQFQRIWHICKDTAATTKTIPSSQSIRLGKVGLSDVKNVEIEDVLGRQPVVTDYAQVSKMIKDRRVLISGAGGSIGSELALQISEHDPAHIVLLDREESALYHVHERLMQKLFYKHEMCIADIKNESRLEQIFRKFKPDLVFHAAAYKHVPLTELHPGEAVLNNVLGTENVAVLSGKHGVRCFVNISTDKAVDPINVLGASKRLGEMITEQLGGSYPQTKYCSVRFGNVLGSRGSVIPIFREQISHGGPVTITHPEMTRYFMLVSEAVDLVLQAAAFLEKSSIYVLEMGKPVRIMDLARQMIEIMKPDEPVETIFTGLRPGEKLHEQLLADGEQKEASEHEMIYQITSSSFSEKPEPLDLYPLYSLAVQNEEDDIKKLLRGLIPSYRPFRLEDAASLPAGAQGHASEKDHISTSTTSLRYQWASPPEEILEQQSST